MNRTASILVLLLGVLALPAIAGQPTTLYGDYRWGSNGPRQPLEASFTATGKGAWDVAFYFKHGGRSHTYRGSARGSLSAGELRGTVKTEDRSRTFSFECTYDAGTFRGTHSEVVGNRQRQTGTLSLKARRSPEVAWE